MLQNMVFGSSDMREVFVTRIHFTASSNNLSAFALPGVEA
jgi:hypothetical protein